jgi:hypothetical protein
MHLHLLDTKVNLQYRSDGLRDRLQLASGTMKTVTLRPCLTGSHLLVCLARPFSAHPTFFGNMGHGYLKRQLKN